MKQSVSLYQIENEEPAEFNTGFLPLLRCALIAALEELSLLTKTQALQVQKILHPLEDPGENQ